MTLADTRQGQPASVRLRSRCRRARSPSPTPADDGTPQATPTGRDGARRLPHFPGLDGLRGLAVIAVLLFHGGFAWAEGGYLGVSTFFTLSGFLITSLLLAERTTTAHRRSARFWVRRIRRLMPAALLALGPGRGVRRAAPARRPAAQPGRRRDRRPRRRGQLALHLLRHQSYADLFSAPSPVLHFWCLAIEEQFYLVFPMRGLRPAGRAALEPRRVGRRSSSGLMALSLGSPCSPGSRTTASTTAPRPASFELLAGCLLAVLIYSRRVTRRLARPGPRRTAVAVAGGRRAGRLRGPVGPDTPAPPTGCTTAACRPTPGCRCW